MQLAIKACLFGASPSTGNQGVNALCWSALAGMHQRGCTDLHVFGYGGSTRSASFGPVDYTLHGMTVGKRIWHADHLGLARLSASLGFNRGSLLSVLSDTDLILDASGGDSFTDLYGNARFRQITAPKEIALSLGRPLVLLPQTYGPFKSMSSCRVARRLIDGAAIAYARDPESYERMQALLAERFDPARHRLGVDLAFGLPKREPASLDKEVAQILKANASAPLIGLNVSGLVANRSEVAARNFGLADDYPELMRRLVMRILDETGARILIVPHVHAPVGHYESDLDASLVLLESLPESYAKQAQERIAVVRKPLNACELKWLIAQCGWFCGTRMHSTIAAISSGVPTAALAYSQKTKGVFKTCAIEDAVVDLRLFSNADALDQLMDLYQGRTKTTLKLIRSLPRVRADAVRQMDEIVNCSRQHLMSGDSVRC